MVTKCYNLINNIPCGMALAEIMHRIPCFMSDYSIKRNADIPKIEITCREADLPFVERVLADFV